MKPISKLTLILFLLLTIDCGLSTLYAEIPRTINYQGKLTDKQGYALNGTYNVTFRLYDAATGGNLLWQEAHSNVLAQKGLFSVLLGTITPLNLAFDKQYYLGIQVGSDQEMAPRQALASAPYAFSAGNAMPAGTVLMWAGETPPDGWLLCDGRAISRTTYANLFNAIGTAYGSGDGSTTFNLPDLRGRAVIGKDNMGGSSANRVINPQADILGGNAGEESHKLTESELPTRTFVTHDTYDRYLSLDTPNNGGYFTGGGQPHNNMPPYLVLNYIIKT